MDIIETELYKCVFKGDCDSLRRLTRNNPEILEGITPQENSALHVAASRGHHEMVELLFRLKPSILFMTNTKGETPLHKAAAAGKLEVVEILLNINNQFQYNRGGHERVHLEASRLFGRSVNKDNETALHYAARGGHVTVVETLLQTVNDIERVVNKAGESALYTACDHGRFDVASRLLNQGVFAGDTRTDGRTCLHVAIHTEQTDLALGLLRQRRELAEKADASGNMPLHLATLCRCLPLVEKLLEIAPRTSFHVNQDKMAPIHIAAREGYTEIIELLINATPQCIEVLGQDNKNALHFALEGGYPFSTCRYLLNDKLDAAFLVNEPDNEGNTAFHKTAVSKSLRVLKEMAKISKWNLNAVNKDGHTVLDKLSALEIFPGQERFFENLLSISRPNMLLEKRKKHRRAVLSNQKSLAERYPAEICSVVAGLLATITFAAGFTVPGGVSTEQGNPVRLHSAAFKAFVISNTLAMFFSMIAICVLLNIPNLAYEKSTGHISIYPILSSRAFSIGSNLISLAFMAAMVSYVTGMYVLVAPRCLWLAVTVCLMGCSVLFMFIFYNSKFRKLTEYLERNAMLNVREN